MNAPLVIRSRARPTKTLRDEDIDTVPVAPRPPTRAELALARVVLRERRVQQDDVALDRDHTASEIGGRAA